MNNYRLCDGRFCVTYLSVLSKYSIDTTTVASARGNSKSIHPPPILPKGNLINKKKTIVPKINFLNFTFRENAKTVTKEKQAIQTQSMTK